MDKKYLVGSQWQNVTLCLLLNEWLNNILGRLCHLVLSKSGGWYAIGKENSMWKRRTVFVLTECLGLWYTTQGAKMRPRSSCQGKLLTFRLVGLEWERCLSRLWDTWVGGGDLWVRKGVTLYLVFTNLSLLRKINECLMGSLRVRIGTRAGFFFKPGEGNLLLFMGNWHAAGSQCWVARVIRLRFCLAKAHWRVNPVKEGEEEVQGLRWETLEPRMEFLRM